MNTKKGTVAPSKFNSFGDWLRMEDSITSRSKDKGTLMGANLGLQVIGENETWEYIAARCEAVAESGRVSLDLTDCLVYAFWTCPTFWELVRNNAISKLTFYAEEEDKSGAVFIANLTGMREVFAEKVTMLSRLYTEELAEEAPHIYMKKCEDGYNLHLEDAFGASGIISIADFLLVEKSVKSLRSTLGEHEVIHINLKSYDIGMIIDRVSALALDDHIAIEVHGTFLYTVLREMAKLREKRSGAKYEDYAIKSVENLVGTKGLLLYEKTSRGYSLPAKITGVMGDTVLFEVISPVNGSYTEYKKFEVSVNLPHLSVDDVLAKRSGFHVFISEKFLPEDFVETVLNKGFPNG